MPPSCVTSHLGARDGNSNDVSLTKREHPQTGGSGALGGGVVPAEHVRRERRDRPDDDDRERAPAPSRAARLAVRRAVASSRRAACVVAGHDDASPAGIDVNRTRFPMMNGRHASAST
jgi:hypothetical protein